MCERTIPYRSNAAEQEGCKGGRGRAVTQQGRSTTTSPHRGRMDPLQQAAFRGFCPAAYAVVELCTGTTSQECASSPPVIKRAKEHQRDSRELKPREGRLLLCAATFVTLSPSDASQHRQDCSEKRKRTCTRQASPSH